MAASASDFYKKIGSPGNATSLAAPGHTIGGTSFTVDSTSLWPTDTGVTFAIDTTTIVNGEVTRTAGSYTVWDGVVASGTTITGGVLRYGTDQNYSAGSTTRVYILPTSTRENKIVDGLLSAGLTQAGGMGAITPTSIVSSGNITAANFIQTGGASANGWTVGLTVPNTVTANGNRSYTCVINSTDLTSQVSAGMRLKFTRTVAAPTQCTSLNGTTQYYSKSSPAGMTFTDDFVVSAWIKLTSYGAVKIASRYNGTSGWELGLQATGQLFLAGYNAGAANVSYVQSYQSVPLNKWVHVTAQLDMSTFTATTTTSYTMIDGVDVPAQVLRSGTNPTVLVQPVSDLQIGVSNTLGFFPGKIAQVAIYNAKVTQANIQATISQGLAGTETSLISAYSFNNSINDLNANANNLTANGSAVATNADSPFGGQADGTISSTLDYGIITKASFSTNTTLVVQVPEGCTIPTSGGVSAVSYSTQKAPYGFPAQTAKWRLSSLQRTATSTTSNATYGSYNGGGWALVVPIGAWDVGWQAGLYSIITTEVYFNVSPTALTGLSINAGYDASPLVTRLLSPSAANAVESGVYLKQPINTSSSSTYVMYTYGATNLAQVSGSVVLCEIFAEFSLL